jgi:hypothetical protein
VGLHRRRQPVLTKISNPTRRSSDGNADRTLIQLRPSLERISSARSPFFCVLTSKTILLSIAAISSADRRGRRPEGFGALGGAADEAAFRLAARPERSLPPGRCRAWPRRVRAGMHPEGRRGSGWRKWRRGRRAANGGWGSRAQVTRWANRGAKSRQGTQPTALISSPPPCIRNAPNGIATWLAVSDPACRRPSGRQSAPGGVFVVARRPGPPDRTPRFVVGDSFETTEPAPIGNWVSRRPASGAVGGRTRACPTSSATPFPTSATTRPATSRIGRKPGPSVGSSVVMMEAAEDTRAPRASPSGEASAGPDCPCGCGTTRLRRARLKWTRSTPTAGAPGEGSDDHFNPTAKVVHWWFTHATATFCECGTTWQSWV